MNNEEQEKMNDSDLTSMLKSLEDEKNNYRTLADTLENRLADIAILTDTYVLSYDVKENTLSQNASRPLIGSGDIVFKNVTENDKLLSYIDERDRTLFVDFVKSIKRSKKNVMSVEYRTKLGIDGTVGSKWVRMSCTINRDMDGNAVNAWGIVKGIDYERLIRERFEIESSGKSESAKNLMESMVVDLTNDHIINVSKNGRYNNASDIMSLKDVRDYIMKNYSGMNNRDDYICGLTKANLLKSYKKNENAVIANWRDEADGKRIWAKTIIKFLRHPDTQHIMAFVYTYDETDSKIRELVINRLIGASYDYTGIINLKTRQYKIYSANMDDSMEPFPMEGNVDYVFLGRSSNFASKKQYELAVKCFGTEEINRHINNEGTFTFTVKINGSDGSVRDKLYRISRVVEGSSYVAISRTDITSLLKKEREISRKMETALIEAKKANDAKTVFLSRMSHDMRTPMNGIVGMTALTMDIPGLTDEMTENLNAISDASKYLLSLINDTLDMSKIESRKMELQKRVVNSEELIEKCMGYMMPSARAKDIRLLFVNKGARLTYIMADPVRLQQIFVNITSNAIKFTPKEGTVELSVECLERKDNLSHLRFMVTDNGVGMSQEFVDKAFDIFSQERNVECINSAGTGLGLSIVKNLVELMGGTITIESELGVGTRVIVDMTLETVEVAEDTHISKSEAANIISGKRVLLCEDHPLNATIAIRLLAKEKVMAEHAENGRIAVEMFKRAEKGYYDAILMDIRMPVMTGLEATRIIRELPREDARTIPIIAMTANAFADDIKVSLLAGMNAHLAKPVEPVTLYRTLAEEIKKGNKKND